MKNTFGQSIAVTVYGESHGPAIGAVIDGFAPGAAVDTDFIGSLLSKRRPSSSIDTPRQEPDNFEILSGVFEGKTTGTPICINIPNENAKSGDYNYGPARPAHADYAAFCKYHGHEDYRGGGHFSGRITAALVAAGGILIPALNNLGIKIGTRIASCAGIEDAAVTDIEAAIDALNEKTFPVIDDEARRQMTQKIEAARMDGNSVGGVTETFVTGLPAGVGEPWFDSAESQISHIVFSLGGVKGIEFGAGFGLTCMTGAEANDPLKLDNGTVKTTTNNNGGINGGITNGMPVVFRCAVKPTASISREQDSVDFIKNEETKIVIGGRHDPAIVRRICPVLDSVTAIVIADMLAVRYGTDVFTKGIS